MGTGILLLNLPPAKAGARPAKGLDEALIGDTSGLLLLPSVFSPSIVYIDSAGEMSSGYSEEDLGGRFDCGGV